MRVFLLLGFAYC